jgi:preprotein translocase subunit SecG
LLYVLYGIFFVACIVLVASVLLQPGKTDAGALFTSNISSSAFGPRGSASILSRITIVAASVFMVTAFVISMPALQGSVSVLQTQAETLPDETNGGPVVMEGDGNTEPAEPDANIDASNEEQGIEPSEAPAANAAPAESEAKPEGQ